MNCKNGEKLIYLFKADELSEIELSELKRHLTTCTNCREKIEGLQAYKNLISKLNTIKTKQVSNAEFTDIVMNAIQEEKIQRMPSRKAFSLAQSAIFRVASIVLILLSSFSFLAQNISIQQSVASLEARYETKKNNAAFWENYNDCVEISQSQISALVEDDMELLVILENSAKGMFPKDIERFASKICQQPVDIKTMDIDDKKRLLFTLLKQNEKL